MLLKVETTIYKGGSYQLVENLEPCKFKISTNQTKASLNHFTQALFRTAKNYNLPFVTANMVGKPFFIVTFRTLGLLDGQTRAMINPQLIWCSDEGQYVDECFYLNGEETVIKNRPKTIKLTYMNKYHKIGTYEFSGRFAAYVMQAIEVMYGLPLNYIPPTPSEVAARLKKIHGG
jgi:peptide deformylase